MANCKVCGNPIETDGGKFCPSCGADIGESAAESPSVPAVIPASMPAPPASIPCPNCGFVNSTVEGKFCQQCGGKLIREEGVILDPVAGQVVAATPYVPPSAPAPLQRRQVLGRKLKVIPIAKLITNLEKNSGMISLHDDGVRFNGKNTLVQCHVEEIAKVAQGNKSDIMGIKMKDGTEYVFKLMGAKKWVKILNEMLPQ